MRAAVHAELLKVRTVRGRWVGLLVALALLPLSSLLVAATGGLGPDDTATSGAATGTVVGLLALGAWAAAVTAGEYAHGTLAVTALAVPRRTRLVGAKLVALTGLAAVGALVAAGVALLVVVAVTPRGEHPLGSPAALLGVVLAAVAVAAVGVAAGFLARATTGAVAAVAVAVLAPKAAGGLLGGLEPWVVGASPGTVVTQLVEGGQLAESQTFPWGTAAAAASMALVAAAVAVAAGLAVVRRDV